MAPETPQKILTEVYEGRRFRKVKIIYVHNAGEALLHPQFEEMTAILKRMQEKFASAGCRFPDVALLTNGCFLNTERSRIILDSGVFRYIRFSMDGGTPERFEALRKGAKWPVFYNNVSHFLRMNRLHKNRVYRGFITLVEAGNRLSTSWMDTGFKELLLKADRYEQRYPHNRAGEVQLYDGRSLNKPYKTGCSMLLKQLVFLPDGSVTVCCSDLNSKGVIGNILERPLYDIYQDRKRMDLLHKLFNGRKRDAELCRNCPSF